MVSGINGLAPSLRQSIRNDWIRKGISSSGGPDNRCKPTKPGIFPFFVVHIS